MGVDFGLPHFDAELEELGLLAQTAGLAPVARLTCKRKAPDAALFVGSGKADEIRMLAQMHGAVEVLFDQALSPAQQRNLERHLELPVTDRTLLILEIFAQRARSHEGKLQVELARLQYLSTRLVRRWSHLERQRGGIGARGGPGETQIELDRRMIDDAIKRTRERLQKVKRQRATQRRQRARRDTFNISLVGYTNAGKSTLFNALVKARAYAADQLFATLDTTTRQLYLAELGGTVSLSDTVGFIRDLPHGLIDAFQATLQEAVDADLLLHVVDASNPDFPEQIAEVEKVLGEIGAGEIPQVLIFNKLDAVPAEQQPLAMQDTYEWDGRQLPKLFVSARTGQGLPELRSQLTAAALAARENPMTPGADAEFPAP
ncbi:GTP-binding protein HflX [Paracidovorax citrulli]|nr:GTP-binding protein HflX [Paracidovorax citrulli]QCX11949.1 GTPase HflX [Paracidovorax citrulli]REG69617.1 GTP-binding protein HflX [Paracidovorax citrulli]RLJ94171.1 GTP-binding protein HflX [Paracidovorax citrulli]SDL29155.1 GTP-binding protein HflX [Paracidovorax citrulli]